MSATDEISGPETVPVPGEPGDGHWYYPDLQWDAPQAGLRTAVPLLAELSGAGVVAANSESEDAYWRGASGGRHWDVKGDGRRVDVKRAWAHSTEALGFGGPKSGSYDTSVVDDILLLHLEDADVTTAHSYEPDGQVRFETTGRPRAA